MHDISENEIDAVMGVKFMKNQLKSYLRYESKWFFACTCFFVNFTFSKVKYYRIK